MIPAKRGALKPVGEWNYQEVIAKGNHIKVILNGEVIVDGDIAKESDNGKATMDHKQHPGLLNEKGHIGFLGHGSEVHFPQYPDQRVVRGAADVRRRVISRDIAHGRSTANGG